MKRILKYQLFASQYTLLPRGKALLVGYQPGVHPLPSVWLEVELSPPDALPKEEVRYFVFGTGQRVPERLEHVGSAICGDFVWHVYRDQN